MNNTDATRLRTLADWFDMYDAKNGNIGMDEVQTSLRDIANRIESSHAHRSRLIESVKKWGGAWRKCRAELKEAKKMIAKYEKALNVVKFWITPETGKFWDKEQTQPTSYETEYGSNGARDYMRKIAAEALKTK